MRRKPTLRRVGSRYRYTKQGGRTADVVTLREAALGAVGDP